MLVGILKICLGASAWHKKCPLTIENRLRLRWGLSETSRNTTPPRAPNGTKKKQMQNQKKFIQKKAIVELHPWKMVWQNCPVSWKFWLPEVISLTMDYCSTQSQITPCNAALENHFELPNRSLKVVLRRFFLILKPMQNLGVIPVRISILHGSVVPLAMFLLTALLWTPRYHGLI